MQQIGKCAFYAVTIVTFGYLFLGDHKQATPPARVKVEKQLTPEEIAQREEAEKLAKIEQERLEKLQTGTRVMNSLKSMEFLLEGAEVDLKKGNINSKMEVSAIGAMLQVIYSTTNELQTAWNFQEHLSAADKAHLKAVEARLSSFQQRSLSKMRQAFKNRTAETLWPHDVTVSLGGSGNTTLKLIGYQYDLNANVQATFDQLNDLTTRLRYKKLIIAPSEYYRGGAVYTLETPADSAVEVYAGSFIKLRKNP